MGFTRDTVVCFLLGHQTLPLELLNRLLPMVACARDYSRWFYHGNSKGLAELQRLSLEISRRRNESKNAMVEGTKQVHEHQ